MAIISITTDKKLHYKLHWLPVTFRIDYKIIIITHKAIHGTAPNYLSSLVNFKPNSSYSLRSNNKYLLSNPNFRTLPTLGDRAFVAFVINSQSRASFIIITHLPCWVPWLKKICSFHSDFHIYFEFHAGVLCVLCKNVTPFFSKITAPSSINWFWHLDFGLYFIVINDIKKSNKPRVKKKIAAELLIGTCLTHNRAVYTREKNAAAHIRREHPV